MESLQDEIREIRKQLRLAMNGVISTSMREKGIVYKLNFGVPYPEIKEIARKHKRMENWRRLYGKKIFVSLRSWRHFSNLPRRCLWMRRNVGSRRFLI